MCIKNEFLWTWGTHDAFYRVRADCRCTAEHISSVHIRTYITHRYIYIHTYILYICKYIYEIKDSTWNVWGSSLMHLSAVLGLVAEGLTSNFWGLGCPLYCTQPSYGLLGFSLLLGLPCGAMKSCWSPMVCWGCSQGFRGIATFQPLVTGMPLWSMITSPSVLSRWIAMPLRVTLPVALKLPDMPIKSKPCRAHLKRTSLLKRPLRLLGPRCAPHRRMSGLDLCRLVPPWPNVSHCQCCPCVQHAFLDSQLALQPG